MNNSLIIKYNVNLFNAPNMKALSEFSQPDIIKAARAFGYQIHKLAVALSTADKNDFQATLKFLELITYNHNKPLDYILCNFTECCASFIDNGASGKLEYFTSGYFIDLLKAEKEAEKAQKLRAVKYARMQAQKIKAELNAVLSRQNKKRVDNLLKYQSLIDEAALDI